MEKKVMDRTRENKTRGSVTYLCTVLILTHIHAGTCLLTFPESGALTGKLASLRIVLWT